ncbi:MAG: FAD-dependent oxidoreductase, partial [Chitinophagaceae bacterium]
MTAQNKKYLIIGQGISGTMLSWFFYQKNISFKVLDQYKKNAPSRIAAGLINPVTGRRYVTVWKDDILLPFAKKTYQEIEAFLQKKIYTPYQILDCFPNPFMKEGFDKRVQEENKYLAAFNETELPVHAPFGIGAIHHSATINLNELINSWQAFLKEK